MNVWKTGRWLAAFAVVLLVACGCPTDPGAPPIGKPTVTFEAEPLSGAAPLTVQFTQESYTTNDKPITGWHWRFGDHSACIEPEPEHTYEQAGSYTVSLTVSVPGAITTVTKEDYITVERPTSTEEE